MASIGNDVPLYLNNTSSNLFYTHEHVYGTSPVQDVDKLTKISNVSVLPVAPRVCSAYLGIICSNGIFSGATEKRVLTAKMTDVKRRANLQSS